MPASTGELHTGRWGPFKACDGQDRRPGRLRICATRDVLSLEGAVWRMKWRTAGPCGLRAISFAGEYQALGSKGERNRSLSRRRPWSVLPAISTYGAAAVRLPA